MNIYTIELRIYSDICDPDEIVPDFGLVPTTTQRKGDRTVGDRIFEMSMCGFGQRNSEGGLIEWSSLEEGIHSLFDEIGSRTSKLIELRKKGNNAVLWCGQFFHGFGAETEISPRLMRRIARFDLDLVLTTYFSSSEL